MGFSTLEDSDKGSRRFIHNPMNDIISQVNDEYKLFSKRKSSSWTIREPHEQMDDNIISTTKFINSKNSTEHFLVLTIIGKN